LSHETRPLLDYSRDPSNEARKGNNIFEAAASPLQRYMKGGKKNYNQLTSAFIRAKRQVHLDTDQMSEKGNVTVHEQNINELKDER
jgi:hypothetical protein